METLRLWRELQADEELEWFESGDFRRPNGWEVVANFRDLRGVPPRWVDRALQRARRQHPPRKDNGLTRSLNARPGSIRSIQMLSGSRETVRCEAHEEGGLMAIHLGIDVGGSSLKAAPVDLETGALVGPVIRVVTPTESTPEAIAEIVRGLIHQVENTASVAAVGLAIPAPVRRGRVPFMANLHRDWAGLHADAYFADVLGRDVVLVNDADAAGLAEVRFGAAEGHQGLVIVTTLGTGIGAALVHRGYLVPNAELGHLEISGCDAETRAASSVKDVEGLSYDEWTRERLQPYYAHIEMLFSPDLIVVGGGVSQDWHEFGHLLELETPIVPARLRNDAGIIGAAMMSGG